MSFLVPRERVEPVVWVTIVALTFGVVTLGLANLPANALQYWYLYASPLLLVTFRFSLRGALAGSVIALLAIIAFYRAAEGTAEPLLESLRQLSTAAGTQAEVRGLATSLRDLSAVDCFTNLIWTLSGAALLSASSLTLGLLLDRNRLQEAENRRAALQFRRFFAPPMVQAIMVGRWDAGLTSQCKDITILFADLRGFTSLAERLEPEELSRLLNKCLSTMTATPIKHDGITDKYVGDGIMASFGDPRTPRAAIAGPAATTGHRVLPDRWRARLAARGPGGLNANRPTTLPGWRLSRRVVSASNGRTASFPRTPAPTVDAGWAIIARSRGDIVLTASNGSQRTLDNRQQRGLPTRGLPG